MLCGLAALVTDRIEGCSACSSCSACTPRLQPREVRHRPRDAARPRPVARQRPARNEHLRRDRRSAPRRRSCSSGKARIGAARAGPRRHRPPHQPPHHARPALRRRMSRSAGIRSARSSGNTRHLSATAAVARRPRYPYFWFLGRCSRRPASASATNRCATTNAGISMLWVFLAVGIGAGNMLAGGSPATKSSSAWSRSGAPGWASSRSPVRRRRVARRGVDRGRVPGRRLRPLRRAAVRLHAAARRRAGEGPHRRHQQLHQSLGMLLASVLLAVFHDRLHVSARPSSSRSAS